MGEWIRFGLSALLMTGGLFFVISSVVGVWRFRYVMNRMHAAALGDTMGLGLILLGLMLRAGLDPLALKLALIGLLWWISGPIASHLTARLEIATNPEREKEMRVALDEETKREVDL